MTIGPYAEFLGIRVEEREGLPPLCIVPPSDKLVGRPGFLHGGAIAGMMELAAYLAVDHALNADERPEMKPISVSVEYLRNGNMRETYVEGQVQRVGSRIVNVGVEAWQEDRDRPIAAARMLFSLRRG